MKVSGRSLAIVFLSSLLVLGGLQSARAGDRVKSDEKAAEAAAEKAAIDWLALIDQSKYMQSWDEAAPYFKSMLNKSQWESQVKAAREPMGKLISRSVKTRQFSKTLPGAPDGEYVVIQFDTKFENKAAAVETITPQKDPDGNWRVSGYFIR